jgi:hypothetical protein
VLPLEDVGFQLQQRRHFCLGVGSQQLWLCIPYTHPTSNYFKIVCWNLSLKLATYKNNWEVAILMNNYYILGALSTLCPRFAVIINNISKDDKTHHVTIGSISQCKCPNFTKMSSHVLRKKGKWVYWKHLCNVFKILCKADHNNSKLIHALMYTYNDIMRPLELASVVEHQCWC